MINFNEKITKRLITLKEEYVQFSEKARATDLMFRSAIGELEQLLIEEEPKEEEPKEEEPKEA